MKLLSSVPQIFFRCLGSGLNRTLEVNSNSLTGIKFSRNTLPLTGEPGCIIITDKPISIKYRIKIRSMHPLTAETQLHIADIGRLINNKYESVSVYNRPIVPDFTTPYLVFGVCSGAIVCIMSAFSKVLIGIL